MPIIERTGAVYCEQACEAALSHCLTEGPGESECREQHRRCLQTCAEMGRVGRTES